MNKRTAEWGHWCITYLAPNGTVVATLDFPIGAQGPQDGCVGSPEHLRLQETIEQWVANEVLPQGAWVR